jgi:hypothetical protein
VFFKRRFTPNILISKHIFNLFSLSIAKDVKQFFYNATKLAGGPQPPAGGAVILTRSPNGANYHGF